MSEAANAKLAEALRAESLGRLADAALDGAYGDYRYSQPRGPQPRKTPKTVLVDLLREYGRDKLAQRVEAGEFDA